MFVSPNIRMSGKNIIFGDKKINKNSFHKNKKLFNIYEIEVDKMLISKKKNFGKKSSFKYFFGYNDDVIRPLCIMFPQIIGYVKHFYSNKIVSFKGNDNRWLKKYTKVRTKVGILMDIEFDSEPADGDNDKYIKGKIKSQRDKVNTNFQDKKVPKENASCKCLSLIMLDSVISRYYFQIHFQKNTSRK